ncbi:MAG: hypothetical protein JWN44_4484 [Myxococcales bacterium]|nr:hypothetical protein [Myxococcales bacterium]
MLLLCGCASKPIAMSDGGAGGGDGGGGGANLTPFANPTRVTINGWTDTAMEPFLSRDGRFLFFNSSNDPGVDTNLHYAERVDDLTFDYRGPIDAANSNALDAVASEDNAGNFYFISTRAYAATRVTLYRGAWSGDSGTLGGVLPVAGLPSSAAGHVIFDDAVSADGATLAFAEGDYSTGMLTSATLGLAARDASGDFARVPTSDVTLAALNHDATVQYAPVFSASLLELYYTRLDGGVPAIYVATRDRVDAPFSAPRKLDAITAFAEAPTLTIDEHGLYYHQLDGTRFAIYRLSR